MSGKDIIKSLTQDFKNLLTKMLKDNENKKR